jgi:hypothetical protein
MIRTWRMVAKSRAISEVGSLKSGSVLGNTHLVIHSWMVGHREVDFWFGRHSPKNFYKHVTRAHLT